MEPIVFILIVAAVAVVGIVGYIAERKRREGLMRWAAARGWTYTRRDDRWGAAWRDHPFDTGFGRRAENVMSGSFGAHAAVAFDYSYKQRTGSGKTRRTTTYRFTVHVLRLPVPLPYVHVEHEGFFDKAAKLFGGQDIELESEDFNRTYRVRGEDPRFAYDLLNPRAMEALLASGPVDVRIEGSHLVHVARGRVDVAGVDSALHLLAHLCGLLPTFVWSDRGAEPPPPLSGASR